MSAMVILLVGLFVTGLCTFGFAFSVVEMRRLGSAVKE
jgi:hypothetical protein